MSLTPLEITLGDINRISVVHRFIKPLIICSQLRNWPTKTFVFSEEKESELEKLTGKRFANAYDYWSEFDEKFFDMGNLMRLTTEFEKGLKYFFIFKKQLANLFELEDYLKNESKVKSTIFQSIFTWQTSNLVSFFLDQINYDLSSNTKLQRMRQLMMVRHLYTHNAGLVDKKYADQYRELTGDSLLLSENDQYEFGPLSQLDSFITDTENFFKELPW